MPTTNIERFDQACGLIFAHLFDRFPQRTMIRSEDIEAVFKASEQEHEDWLSQYVSREAFFGSTMTWLIDAGYIWCAAGQDNNFQTIFTQCVLTPKALEALKVTPTSLSTGSLGESLKEAAKSGALDAAKDLANQVISKGWNIATTAAMSVLSQA
ncbi:hypothetical protein VA602_03705 [Pseudomonas sp. MH2]|uniref:Uncharacterized protein n=1 Tax=Pseudomonas machongensis TaxID=3110229 RepID=A0ABU5VAQ8_9PSED|nr:hypothetical protein [Pseudomonas sp. MH2]MEA5670441.1 hypothetical protein [Pseudomonas sp. MH2]